MEAIIAMINILLSTPAVAGVVQNRIYPIHIPQGDPHPTIVLATISNSPLDTKSGASDFDMVRVQIDIISDRYPEASDISTQVRSTLDRVTHGTYNDVQIGGIKLMSTRDNPREEDRDLFRISQDYQIIIHR